MNTTHDVCEHYRIDGMDGDQWCQDCGADVGVMCVCDECCPNGHCTCADCNEPCGCEFCPECGDEMNDTDDNLRPTWSDEHDDIVCWWCATETSRQAYAGGSPA
jgi:hypothetical protein